MDRKATEIDALRTYIRHLEHAVATTTCPKTVDVLWQMLRETEVKLCAIDPRPPAGNLRGGDRFA
jgi:hypothetical protein